MAWNIGDTVKLKSGGPIMTVSRMGREMGHSVVVCVWFEGATKHQGGFPEESLEAVNTKGAPRSAN
jgi:uncharacterized protein YodC (DUF2158 family)